MEKSANNGFLIVWVGGLVDALHFLSPAEWFKEAGFKVWRSQEARTNNETRRKIYNNLIDSFTVLKWGFLILAYLLSFDNHLALLVTSYLIFFNFFSYFHYHAWGSVHPKPLLNEDQALWRERRRFVAFLQALSFSFLGFAYLYAIQFPTHFKWACDNDGLSGLYLSISNSFTITDDTYGPTSELGRWLMLLQMLNMFAFVSILLTNSIPTVGRAKE
jgi:hypothetical protein